MPAPPRAAQGSASTLRLPRARRPAAGRSRARAPQAGLKVPHLPRAEKKAFQVSSKSRPKSVQASFKKKPAKERSSGRQHRRPPHNLAPLAPLNGNPIRHRELTRRCCMELRASESVSTESSEVVPSAAGRSTSCCNAATCAGSASRRRNLG